MIRFDDVSKTYPDGTVAIERVSLEVPTGQTLVLVGSSGSGKTTLLRMVNRMVTPTSGRVFVDDTDVSTVPVVQLRRSIGYVLQAVGLLPHRTVADNIATVPLLTGTPKKKARSDARALLERVGLEPDLAGRYPSQLSGGQAQRVGVARALANDPELLLMDEPFGAVDPIVREDLQEEMVRLQSELGKTILFVTHDVEEAFRIGDTVVVMSTGGTIEQIGTPAEILAHPVNDFVSTFVGAGKPARDLELRDIDGRRVAVDGTGKPVGIVR